MFARLLTAAAVLGTILALVPVPAFADDLHVTVDAGALSGLASRDGLVRSFKGIPYAAAPVGAQRWRPPQPVAAWQGAREANGFAPICPQRSPIPGAFYQREFFQTAEPQSEDCLYLNVWTPAPSGTAPRPVMVFIHGGGWQIWSGSMASFDGTALARKGVIVVTLNYRLGPLGFLAHPELDAESPGHVSGNYGLLDQMAALRWVQANIAAFGGDPKRVTIFGQSSGASAVAYLTVSPLAKGLFQRAIIESSSMAAGTGGTGPTATLATTEEGGKRMVAELGAPSVAALRAMPAAEMITRTGPKYGTFGLAPAIDGWLLTGDILPVIAAGQQNNVELMIGSTADETTPYFPSTTPEALQTAIQTWFGAGAGPIAALYQGSDTATATIVNNHFRSDYATATARVAARVSAEHGHPAWVYSFDRPAPGSDPIKLGAFHCAELAYVFGTQNTIDRPWEAGDRQLSDTMSSYWVRFAETGNPNGPNLPAWPAFEGKQGQVKVFGTRASAEPDLKGLPLLEEFVATRLAHR